MAKDKSILSKHFWKKFFSIFTDAPLGNQIEDSFQEMMILAEDMYVHVTSVIIDPDRHTLEHIRETFFLTDKRINSLEEKIRRDILLHLSISGGKQNDITSYLLLLNEVKDAERIGDYAKNIFDIFEYAADAVTGVFLEDFAMLRTRLISNFAIVRTAITKMDTNMAKTAFDECTADIINCNTLINRLMHNPSQIENPVAVALLFRYQKRILSHLRKIATAQFAPFDKLGASGKSKAEDQLSSSS